MAPLHAGAPRCIVLPIVGRDPRTSDLGLALHFLLGNVIVLHAGFREFWFGWRVAKIFPAPEDLRAYCQTGAPDPDPVRTGRAQDIRFWIAGALSGGPGGFFAALWLIDAQKEARHLSPDLAVDTDGHLTGLRKRFIEWLDTCGRPFPESQRKKALWPEQASADGLATIGRALKTFYLQSAFGGRAPVDIRPFEDAVSEAPAAFMAHDLLGWARYRNGLYREARQAFLESVRINAHGAGAQSGLMRCAAALGDRDAAVSWAERKAASCSGDAAAARKSALKLFDAAG